MLVADRATHTYIVAHNPCNIPTAVINHHYPPSSIRAHRSLPPPLACCSSTQAVLRPVGASAQHRSSSSHAATHCPQAGACGTSHPSTCGAWHPSTCGTCGAAPRSLSSRGSAAPAASTTPVQAPHCAHHDYPGCTHCSGLRTAHHPTAHARHAHMAKQGAAAPSLTHSTAQQAS